MMDKTGDARDEDICVDARDDLVVVNPNDEGPTDSDGRLESSLVVEVFGTSHMGDSIETLDCPTNPERLSRLTLEGESSSDSGDA
jgi:hypothetical protein